MTIFSTTSHYGRENACGLSVEILLAQKLCLINLVYKNSLFFNHFQNQTGLIYNISLREYKIRQGNEMQLNDKHLN